VIAKLLDQGLVGERLTFHGLRHTAATLLIEAGRTSTPCGDGSAGRRSRWRSTMLRRQILIFGVSD